MRYVLPLVLIVAGCSQPSPPPQPVAPAPKYPTLAAGQAVMISGTEAVLLTHVDDRPWTKDDAEYVDFYVLEGDRGLVLKDEGADDKRKTKVRMETGDKAGRLYLIARRYLTPLNIPPR